MSKKIIQKVGITSPDAHLKSLIARVTQLTEAWAHRHDLWHDSWHKDPLQHYNDEPGTGVPILLLCSDGPAMSSLQQDDVYAQELRGDLEKIGVYLEFEDRVTACYHLIDEDSDLQKEFDRHAEWRWICRLVEADSAEISGDLYQYFASNPEDFHRLPHREFEKLVSSIFAARGWRTELGPGSGDKGVDLRIWQTDPLGDLLTLVQIKRYAPRRAISLEAVAALDSHVNREGANRGLFVTSSRYLPGVKDFADKTKYRLQLMDATHLQQWCQESVEATRATRNRVLARESFGPLIEEISLARTHPRLVIGGKFGSTFCVVLRETKNSALLLPIPSVRVSGNIERGQLMPALDGQWQGHDPDDSVFRAIRSEKDGRVSYWGRRSLYHVWDGRPCGYDYWD